MRCKSLRIFPNGSAFSVTGTALACLLAICVQPLVALPPQPLAPYVAQASAQASNDLSNDQVIQRIDAAVKARVEGIASYTVQELYSIYRNGEANPSAQVTVKTAYMRGVGKEYTPISATGSSILRSAVIDKVLANEKEMAKAANRENVAVTSANYEMQLQPGHITINGRDCVTVSLKARRKTTYLFNGKGWFDSSDYTLVRLEGAPAQSVSIFAGDAAGKRDYTKVDGFSMAQHAEMKTHNFLLGETIMKIDYSDYQIQLEPKSNAGVDSHPQAGSSASSSN